MKKLNCYLRNTTLCLHFMCLFLSAQNPPPPHDWKKVTWRDKDIVNAPGLSQNLSGDEWWFSHKNLYEYGEHVGYIAVGYLADLVKPGDETKMQNLFNDGTDSPANTYTNNSTIFNSPNGWCDEFYDEFYNSSGKVNEMRTAFRGMVARLDLEGNMIWCRLPNQNGDGLQEVVQSGQYIYVIGNHSAAKTVTATNKQWIPYNATNSTEAANNIFDVQYFSPPTTTSQPVYADGVHMYVANLT